ncbi:hypothetical protein CONLIGDRAFT_470741 [Coniochaeta ligniaria NRRL 30616]|uniref:NYN domain-containing protein n=1 Tax=Coniochaeta ligniaria NRRL 30616 TaxID=1408157 RepID=A0A1J7IZ82_9PEZI|nr:hypothetical protein CONLIGDRAFT_470741 [Coniochaeta ligniaria NRRL 30616]
MFATTSREVVVFRPPSPRLGNFNEIFDEYMQQAAGTEPKIDVEELNDFLDAIGKVHLDFDLTKIDREKQSDIDGDATNETLDKTKGYLSEASSAKTVLHIPDNAAPRKPSARLVKAAKGLFSGAITEFKPSPPQDAIGDDATPTAFGFTSAPTTRGTIPRTSSETSDTLLHQQSVFDQTPWQYASETTPLTSPEAVLFAHSPESTPTKKGNQSVQNTTLFHASQTTTVHYDYATVGLSGFQAVNFNSSSSVNVQGNIAYSTNIPINDPQGVDNKSSSSNGLFRYQLSQVQPFKAAGAELYTVVPTKSGVDRITPHYMSTKEDKMRVLEYKLQHLKTADRATEKKLRTTTNNVHVFVDLSNITIGFYDCLRASHKIPATRRMKAPKFTFDHLAMILERGRNIEKRVVAGSLDTTYVRKWPTFMQEAKDLDYEMCILQRVAKAVVPTTRNKRMSTIEPEWTASDDHSSSEETFLGQLKQGEQGVDELLHLKMLQSVLDAKPGTAVLATGDAAEAEFSDGFKKNVERLLSHGWNVEILGWQKGISKAWKEPEFAAQYGDRLRVIELDQFVEEIFGAWFGAPGY